MSVFLDHDYCAVMPSDEIKNDKTPSETDGGAGKVTGAHRRKQQFSVREDLCVESSDTDVIPSSLSPAHSTDSGVDSGGDDFWANFSTSSQSWRDELDFGLYDDDLKDIEALLSDSFHANELAAGNDAHSKDSGTPSTKANVPLPKGKQVSDEDEQAILERNKKNAIAARENRQRKKKYVEGLESEVGNLKEENKTLKTRNESMSKMIMKLSSEVKYLRNILANQSTISLLLKSVAATPGISLTSSLLQSSISKDEGPETESEKRQYITRSRKRNSDIHQSEDITDCTPSKKARGTTPGGVCLHVNKGKVSLELCAECEEKALQSGSP